jgi:hypothetical protein
LCEARRELLQAMISHQPRSLAVELVDVHAPHDAHQLRGRQSCDQQHRDRPHRQQAFYKSAAFMRQ